MRRHALRPPTMGTLAYNGLGRRMTALRTSERVSTLVGPVILSCLDGLEPAGAAGTHIRAILQR